MMLKTTNKNESYSASYQAILCGYMNSGGIQLTQMSKLTNGTEHKMKKKHMHIGSPDL